jgi:AcrR family transcriptional regulator
MQVGTRLEIDRERKAEESLRRRGAEERLLDAVVVVSDRAGYGALSVERVLREASVSRASFYQYFSNVADCFWSAYRLQADSLCARVASRVGSVPQPLPAVLEALARDALSSPRVARLLMAEPLAAGPRGLLERDALIGRLGQLAGGVPASASAVDLPLAILIGGCFRFLSMTLEIPDFAEDPCAALREWCQTFARGPGERRWSDRLTPQLTPTPKAPVPPVRGGSAGDARPRGRIIRATAALVHERGLHAITVADIATAAGVSRRSFYNEFSDRLAAYVGAYEYAFEQGLGLCAPAFFSAEYWPERVWQSARAFTGFLAREPSLCYVGFVESFAAGREFSRRVNETQLAFTLFLEEGYRHGSTGAGASRAAAALTAVTIAEVGAQAARASPGRFIRGMMPLAVYVALAPFIGSDEAGAFVAGKLTEGTAVAGGDRLPAE